MANLGNLIVRGVTRILGDAYANKFIGNLQGNADTATSAIKASTADSATSATSANKASIATAVQDYGTSSYREIKIGYTGSGLSSSDITHAVGFTDSGTKIKDISKDEFRNWLATASGTWPITVSNSSNSANAEYANYLNVTRWNEFRFGNISSDQTTLWFNYANPDDTQNNVSTYYFGDGKNGTNSTIIAAQFTGNAASASTIAVGQGAANVYRSVYFADNSSVNSVVVDSKLKYNPSSGDLNVTKINNGTPITSLNIGFNNGYIPKYVEFPGPEELISLGYHTQDHIYEEYYYFLGLLKWAYNKYKNKGSILLIGCASPNSVGNCQIQLYSSESANSDGVPKYASGLYESLNGTIYTFSSYEYNYRYGQINANNANAVNGVSLTWGGEITSSQWIAAWESGTSIRAMSAYNTFISMCSYLDEGSSDVTDGTMFITSYATDNGFSDPNGKNKPYKRKASFLWNYINNKCSSIYATTAWINDNFYTYSESDNRYIRSETDPVWTAAKGNYYTKTECDNKFQPKGTYLTEQNLQGYATQSWVRGEEYLYRSGGTMDARATIGITTKLFIGNSTSSDTCYTKFNCILHGGGDESNPNWVIRDNGYSEFKSSVSANAFYASSDIRLKNILDDINIDFDKLKLIPKKYYTWKGSDILQLGTIAQDIQKIYPEVVSKNENGYLSVDYSKLSIIALAAIDKLNERIKELECQIKL